MSQRDRTRSVWFILSGALILGAIGCSQSPGAGSKPPSASSPIAFVPDTKPVPEVHWIDGTVPKGTPVKLSMIDTLGPQFSHKGDSFRALVTEAIMIRGVVVVPSSSNVLGTVSDVTPETIRLQFDRIDTPTGASAPIKASLRRGPPGAVYRSNAPIVIVLDETLRIKVKQ